MTLDAAPSFALETTMRIRGDASVLETAGSGSPAPVRRFDASPWRDPRLIAGVLIVLASTVLGGWAIAAADHTVGYWATRSSVRVGDPVHREDLVAVHAKVPSRTARGLLRTDQALPGRFSDLRWAIDARAGTLVTSNALAPRGRAVELPFSVPAGGIPSDLRSGDRVDVWAVPERAGSGSESTARARRVLSNVRVVSRSSSSGISGGPGVTLVVDAAGTKLDAALMGALSTQRLTVVRVS
jgi:hypothetical protein